MSKISIYVSADTAAVSLGSEQVATEITRCAKARNIDIELLRNGSRGMVWLEPLVEVVTDNGRVAYANICVADVDALFDADFHNGGESHSSYCGLTENIDYFKNQQRVTFHRVGKIVPDNIEAYKAEGGFQGLSNALSMSGQQIVDAILSSGLRGRGGAGFPAGIKWQTVLDADPAGNNPITEDQKNNTQKYIVCNADEGDSGTFSDRMLMEGDPLMLIEGMTIAGIAVNATKGYIYLRSEYPKAQAMLNSAIENAVAAGYLGDNICGSDKSFSIEVRMAAGAYICGEETALLESLEGKRGMVRAKPPLPALEGFMGQPTVVNNVITLASATAVLAKGADNYNSFGLNRSLGTLAFQLAGNIKRGGLVELAFGHTLRELIEDFGGGTYSGRPAKAIQVGGPLGAYLPESQWDTPLDYEAYAAMGAMIGHGGIVVFDDTVDMAQQAEFAMEFCVKESCGKCTPCRIGSVRGVETIQKIRQLADDELVNESNRETKEDAIKLLTELCDTMFDGSLCAMGGMTPVPVRSVIKHFNDDL